jgi:hypothetical protein
MYNTTNYIKTHIFILLKCIRNQSSQEAQCNCRTAMKIFLNLKLFQQLKQKKDQEQ